MTEQLLFNIMVMLLNIQLKGSVTVYVGNSGTDVYIKVWIRE